MYVKRHMSTPAVTIEESRSLGDAGRLLKECGFRHLPVVDGRGRLVGMLSDRDTRSSGPSVLSSREEREELLGRLEEVPVRDVMTVELKCLTLSSTLDDALYLFGRKKIGALPVTDEEGRVSGVFSVQDLMAAFREIFGLEGSGFSLIEIVDDGQPGLLTSVFEVIDGRGLTISRLIRVPGDGGGRPPVVYLRISTYNLHALLKDFSDRNLRVRIDTPEGSHGGE